jgi:ATP-dependent protease ClpP protease subunit
VQRIEEDSDRDFYMGAADAVKYGLVDEVLTTLKKGEGK